jgi:hypothetical protein
MLDAATMHRLVLVASVVSLCLEQRAPAASAQCCGDCGRNDGRCPALDRTRLIR